jgi:nitronate monooxygenase
MWNHTIATRRLGIEYPIIQGPFGGGPSSVQLVAAVSNAGGMGSYGMQGMHPDEMRSVTAAIYNATDQPFALNLWIDTGRRSVDFEREEFDSSVRAMSPLFRELGIEPPKFPEHFLPDLEEQYAAILELKPPVFSFVFGIPSASMLEECRRLGILTMGTATTAEEARQLESAGVDIVVASAFEAGGHKGSFLQSAEESLTGAFALIPQVADAVSIPVIAAGGIADGRGVAAALMLGAHGVQIGTAFLATEESAASSAHRAALFRMDAAHTVLTTVVTGRLARHIPSAFIRKMESSDAEAAVYPVQAWLGEHIKRVAYEQKQFELLSFPAGQAAPLVRRGQAAALMASLVDETDVLFRKSDAHPDRF